MVDTAPVSVIVPVRNAHPTLGRCLAAIAASDYGAYECVVVDDGSTDGSTSVARSYGCRLVRLSGGPYGPAHARNQGAAVASGDILLFVDADVVVAPDTLTRAAAVLTAVPDVAAVFGSYDDSPAATNFVSQYRNLLHHFVHQRGRPEAATFWSGCGAVHREAFHAVGGFDERHYPQPSIEDIDLGHRLRAAGYRVRLQKDMQVKHLKRWSLTSMVRSDLMERALPWTRLILEEGAMPDELNLRRSQRLSALLIWAAAAYATATLAQPKLFPGRAESVALPLLALAAVGALNRELYSFLARHRGVAFAVRAVPLHWLYFVYSSVAFGVGTALYAVERLGARRARSARREFSLDLKRTTAFSLRSRRTTVRRLQRQYRSDSL